MSLLGRACGDAGACGLERQPGAAQGRVICAGAPPPAPCPTHRAGGARGRELPPWQRVRAALQVDPLAYLHGLGRLTPTARCVRGGGSALLGSAVSSARSLSLSSLQTHCALAAQNDTASYRLHAAPSSPVPCTLSPAGPLRCSLCSSAGSTRCPRCASHTWTWRGCSIQTCGWSAAARWHLRRAWRSAA